ncbi:HNH endonuclease [Nocardioides sp.]|uniref:HNH endonuclease n=1 Tax=Nocardioides sp. TaxID=35761 RepID=UPI00286CF7AD|nr:HNH endonuclease [Nocardioides sp.]
MLELGIPQLRQVATALAALPRDVSDAERIGLITTLERLKNAASAAQAMAAVDVDHSQRAAQVEAQVPARRVGEGVAAQLGLARRESPFRGARWLSVARVLRTQMPHTQMPHTLRLMASGALSEHRASILVKETDCLDETDRRHVDHALCGAGGNAASLSTRALEQAARRHALQLDTSAVVERAAKAEADRHVTIRPAPDTMTWVGALLPVKQGVGVYAALKRVADLARAAGDPRSRGQVMADTLFERVTGASAAEPVSITLDLVMTDRAFFATTDEAAHLPGYGPVAASWARALTHQALSHDTLDGAQLWVRRLYITPGTGCLVTMDSRARRAPKRLARFIARRDHDLCRTPWCGAPIAQTDHVTDWADGAPTTVTNTQGLCIRCNLAKQAHGWRARPLPGAGRTHRHTVATTAPTGHTYHSRAPAPPGHVDVSTSPVEQLLYDLIA